MYDWRPCTRAHEQLECHYFFSSISWIFKAEQNTLRTKPFIDFHFPAMTSASLRRERLEVYFKCIIIKLLTGQMFE